MHKGGSGMKLNLVEGSWRQVQEKQYVWLTGYLLLAAPFFLWHGYQSPHRKSGNAAAVAKCPAPFRPHIHVDFSYIHRIQNLWGDDACLYPLQLGWRKQLPEIHCPARLAELMSYKFSKRTCSKIQCGEQWSGLIDDGLWFPHVHIYVHTNLGAHLCRHMCLYPWIHKVLSECWRYQTVVCCSSSKGKCQQLLSIFQSPGLSLGTNQSTLGRGGGRG